MTEKKQQQRPEVEPGPARAHMQTQGAEERRAVAAGSLRTERTPGGRLPDTGRAREEPKEAHVQGPLTGERDRRAVAREVQSAAPDHCDPRGDRTAAGVRGVANHRDDLEA